MLRHCEDGIVRPTRKASYTPCHTVSLCVTPGHSASLCVTPRHSRSLQVTPGHSASLRVTHIGRMLLRVSGGGTAPGLLLDTSRTPRGHHTDTTHSRQAARRTGCSQVTSRRAPGEARERGAARYHSLRVATLVLARSGRSTPRGCWICTGGSAPRGEHLYLVGGRRRVGPRCPGPPAWSLSIS